MASGTNSDSHEALEHLLAAEFPVREDGIYLNHAAVAPWPLRAGRAANAFADDNVAHGSLNYPAWGEAEQALRETVARLINANATDIAFLKNTSEGLSVVAHGFPWKAGDNVVISDEEFPSNRIVWESLAPLGVEVRQVSLGMEPEDALLAACDDRTRVLAISTVEYASGLRMNLGRLGEACHRRDIALCVDAIQGLGAIAHDVQAMHIDFLAADAHKWMLGPEGIAVFYSAPHWRDRLTLHQFGWHMVEHAHDFGRLQWEPAASARRFECGSPNMLGIHILAASLSLLNEIGIETVEARILANSGFLYEEIARHDDLRALSRRAPGRVAGIVTFAHARRTQEELYQLLRENKVMCAPRGGGIRFSPHCYNTQDELRAALEIAAS
jgi:cysteine desulfurase/selenocysteine lyase